LLVGLQKFFQKHLKEEGTGKERGSQKKRKGPFMEKKIEAGDS